MPSRTVPSRTGRSAVRPAPATPTNDRFRRLDPYRVAREFLRYEGTPQRDLFRILRERFLDRNAGSGPWALDVGSGPLRFTSHVGSEGSHRVALDLSRTALAFPRPSAPGDPGPIDRVRGNAVRPPFAPGRFGTVAVLGNSIGFAGGAGERLLDAASALTAPAGRLLLEIAPGPGEHSRYLARLPPSAGARLLRSPLGAVAPRIEREGFAREPWRKRDPGTFRRWDVAGVSEYLAKRGWSVNETVAVAPVLGPLAERIAAVRGDPKSWGHLLELEEAIGRRSERWRDAASVLIATTAPGGGSHTLK